MGNVKMRQLPPLEPAVKSCFDDAMLVRCLKKPEGTVDVVFDSDTYNEVDDQYALVYLLRSGDKLRVKALYAAPFFNERSSSPQDGMEKSCSEMKNILQMIGREDLYQIIRRGSEGYLPSESVPVDSEAARDLARRAMEYTPERPLYVVAIGAITNIASALLLNPEISNRIVIVWLGGHAFDFPNNYEFNLRQDIAAARVVYGSGAAVVMLPCRDVVSAFSATRPELEYWLRGKNAVCDYLLDSTITYAESRASLPTWSKPIWDVTAVAWLLDGDFMQDRWEHSPIAEYDHRWAFDNTRHMIKYVYHIDREKLFYDLFTKLAQR